MKAFEFQTALNPDKTLAVPPEVANLLPAQGPVRVIVLVEESDEERDWLRFGAEQFLKGYAESDAIYDQLSGG